MTERVTGQITEKLLIVYRAGLEDMDKKPYLPSVSVCEVASQILDIDGLEVRADDQSTPPLGLDTELDEPLEWLRKNRPESFAAGANAMRGSMLNAGFVKVLK